MKSEELVEILTDMVEIVSLKGGPDAWNNGEKTLMYVKVPKELKSFVEELHEKEHKLFKPDISELSTLESIIRDLIMQGLSGKAMKIRERQLEKAL